MAASLEVSSPHFRNGIDAMLAQNAQQLFVGYELLSQILSQRYSVLDQWNGVWNRGHNLRLGNCSSPIWQDYATRSER